MMLRKSILAKSIPALAGFVSLCLWSASSSAIEAPAITEVRIESTEVLVAVRAPAGVRKVTLESRTRLAAGTWVPRAVRRLDGSKEETFTFRLPKAAYLEVLRVRADAAEPLPDSFYSGTKEFNGQASSSAGDVVVAIYNDLDRMGGVPESAGGDAREVVESDIWKIRGNTLYFFNQYRGLQVIDLTAPDTPRLTGSLALPAAGEQMYVPDDEHVVLLARDGCAWGINDGSAVLVVRIQDGVPAVAARLPVGGSISESRLVGSALYVASLTYKRVELPPGPDGEPGGEQWEWGTQVASFDLSDLAAPRAKDLLWFSGYGNVVSATDSYLFVITQSQTDWWQSLVVIMDITAPDGTLKPLATVSAGGRVSDKFKVSVSQHPVHGDVLSVISEDAGIITGRRASILQTYSLSDPTAPKKLGSIEVGHGESLFATRFDGARVYIVTYLRTDPLWVVDLSDPVKPVLSGELHVPGWSTYIHPLGDRLVTIGIDDTSGWKVAVSLFDVRDVTKPTLLSKVTLGESGSWSEANWDEKAFSVLPGAGLVLVPYGEWSSQGYATQVQLIDLGDSTLTKRGVIPHNMQPRRATTFGDRILSVSGTELLVVNSSNRDHPAVTANLELSWPVNRVLIADGYLIEAEDGSEWPGPALPVLRVVRAEAPDVTLAQVTLQAGQRLAGATIRDGVLFALQGTASVPMVGTGEDGSEPQPPKPNVTLSAFSLADLPELKLLTRCEVAIDQTRGFGEFKALWPKPGVLVWASSGGFGPWFLDVVRVGGFVGGAIADWWWWPRWGYNGGFLLAFDTAGVTSGGNIGFLSSVDLSGNGEHWNFSDAYQAEALVYLSHRTSFYVPGPGKETPPDEPREPGVILPEPGFWQTKDYLDVVDFADPANPTVRAPIEIPGQLNGIGAGGALLYTVGYHYDPKGATDGTEWVDALAYDGVSASLVASLKLPAEWPHPVRVGQDVFYVGRPDTTSSTGLIETWALATDGPLAGTFTLLGSAKLDTQAQSMVLYGRVLAVSTATGFEAWDTLFPASLARIGSGAVAGCLWADLDHGDASLVDGLWLPLQNFGVFGVPVKTEP